MDTSTMQLAVGMSTLIWALIFLITMAGGVVALTKRAPLLGAGLLVSGLFGGLGIIVHRALPALMAVVDDSASTNTTYALDVQPWIGVLCALIQLVSMVLVLVGVIKLARR